MTLLRLIDEWYDCMAMQILDHRFPYCKSALYIDMERLTKHLNMLYNFIAAALRTGFAQPSLPGADAIDDALFVRAHPQPGVAIGELGGVAGLHHISDVEGAFDGAESVAGRIYPLVSQEQSRS